MATLYVIATPIGNLEDITLRAIRVLKEVDMILSEDTRETDKVLKKYDIQTSQISYREQNHSAVLPQIIDHLSQNKNLALVSDSGTPLISDPGFKLIYELRKLNFNIVSIPGPSALVSAMSISGLPTDRITFLGFLPRKSSQRVKILRENGALENTLVIYESPFRVKKLLDEVEDALGDRTVAVMKDLTKMHEECKIGRLSEIDRKSILEKGEYVILIAKEGFEL